MSVLRHFLRRRRLVGEGGFVIPTALMVLFVITMLAGTAVVVSTRTSSSTTRDDNVKAALEAAEGGLQVASYRLGQLQPGATECIAQNAGEVPSTGTYCKASSAENLGNGATFQYWTSLPLAVGNKCAGQTISEIKTGETPRCVTAEGKVSGVAQRVSALVESSIGESLFPVKGIVGLSEVKVSGSVKIPAVVASNEKIIGEGSAAFERGYELCPPKGSFTPKAGTERNASGVTVGGVGGMLSNPAFEITRNGSECPIKAPLPSHHATVESNEDGRIGVQDEFVTEGKTKVNYFTGAPNYELHLGANSKLTLNGSKYYLCNFFAERNSRLVIAATAKVEIFVDSPEDPASKCPAEKGKFEGEGEFIVENLAKSPAALLIEVYGKGPVAIKNGSALEASIYAPEAEVNMNGGTKFKGGIVGNKVHISNGTGVFEWNEGVSSLTNGLATGYARAAWEQCNAGSGASEGC
jgi:Tfp pilus assembly protein PilX